MLYQLDPARIFQVYIFQLFAISICIILAFILLHNKAQRSRRKLVFSGYYLFTTVAGLMNIIYAPLTDELLNSILYGITLFSEYYAAVFITLFSLLMYYSLKDKEFPTRYQIMYSVIYTILLLLVFLFPQGIVFSETTLWKPTISFALFVFVLVLHVSMSIPLVFYSYKIFHILKVQTDEIYVKRWTHFIIGWILIYGYMDVLLLTNLLNNELFRILFTPVGGVLMIVGSLLIFSFLGRKFKK